MTQQLDVINSLTEQRNQANLKSQASETRAQRAEQRLARLEGQANEVPKLKQKLSELQLELRQVKHQLAVAERERDQERSAKERLGVTAEEYVRALEEERRKNKSVTGKHKEDADEAKAAARTLRAHVDELTAEKKRLQDVEVLAVDLASALQRFQKLVR